MPKWIPSAGPSVSSTSSLPRRRVPTMRQPASTAATDSSTTSGSATTTSAIVLPTSGTAANR